MENANRNHNEKITSFFDQDIRWWQDVYREDLPRGFFSFEMRQRLTLVTELLTAQIQKMDKPDVLECGCGPGDILKLLAPFRCKLTGIDLNLRYLDLAADKVPEATLIVGNVEQLPFADASFDIVYAVGVFQYLNNDRAAAKEICRVTKDAGFVLISFANYRMLHLLIDPYYIFRIFKKILDTDRQLSNSRFDGTMIRRYSLAQLRKIFREHDMHEIQSLCSSYGPLKFWQREFLPLATSIHISEIIRHWSEFGICAGLKHVGNHLTIILHKGPISAEAGDEDLYDEALATK